MFGEYGIELIAAIFFVVALVYSSVGLGGGSSYTAIMTLAGFSLLSIPMISLVMNLLVSSVGSFNFIRHRHGRFRLVMPFLLSSMPAAYAGGALQLPKTVFYWVLLASLVFVALRIYVFPQTSFSLSLNGRQKLVVSLLAGAVLGLVAGVVGIGGGIYLVPLIIILGLGSHKEAAACGAIFIFLNSLAGLASRVQYNAIDLAPYWSLGVAVVAGGIIGSSMGSSRISPATLERILGVVILAAIGLLARKLLF